MRVFVYSFLIGLTLLFSACGEGTADEQAASETLTWTLEEDLRINEEKEYFLGSVSDIAVRADGTMLVADGEATHIKVISSTGELRDTIGRKGEGPGEFGGSPQLSLARGDSLYALDGRRLSVFAPPSYSLARTVQIADSPDGRRYPTKMKVPPAEGFLVSYTVPPILGGKADTTWYRVGEDGKRLGPVKVRQLGRQKTNIQADRTIMPVTLPFAPRSVIALGPDGRLYHGVTDSRRLTVSDLSGQTLDQWSLPGQPRPMTDEALSTFIEGFTDEAAARFGESIRTPTREALREELGTIDLPDTQPAFYDLVVDDRQRVWIRRSPEKAKEATWWVMSSDGELLAKLTLPGDVRLQAVQGEYAYGTISGQEVLPTVIRYRIDEDA